MKFKIVEKIELNEMAVTRGEAISTCIHEGAQFANHFNKIMDDGKNHNDFAHHCGEMQAWWNDVKNLKLKSNKKLITNDKLYEWFFVCGQVLEDVIKPTYCESYKTLCKELLSNRNKTILDVFLTKIFK